MNGRPTVEPSTAQALNAFVDRLGDEDLPPISPVLLYGSQARGDHHQDSAIDVAVVFHDPPLSISLAPAPSLD
ncbi:MAG: nucleotidyltransferase domain-containing protein [Gammaproteobacteria bacterium]|nr:nucleotidyltransferase domain-containing protein [Gammaproteobacteria bacterium]